LPPKVVIYADEGTEDGCAGFDRLSTNSLGISEMGSTSFPSEILETLVERGSQ
jgi:hypothetical protein